MAKHQKMVKQQKPDNLLTTLVAVARIGLMIIGIIGLAVEIFRDDGWLKQLFAKMADSPANLIAIPVVIIVLYFVNGWISVNSDKKSAKGDLPLYVMMAIGVFFLFHLITTGSF